jgi:maltooligosyltrehalose trehalohydrolase
MVQLSVTNRTLGVNFEGDVAKVVVWAPEQEAVKLYLPEGDQYLPLSKATYGYWCLETSELKSGQPYAFEINGAIYPDPASLLQVDGVHGTSVALDLKTLAWNSQHWRNIPLKDYIIYELHVGTFTGEGTLASAIDRLDYLVDLGITAVELMPLAQFPGSRNWGYDGVFPFAVQNSYGGIKGLHQFVDACHSKGLSVILDVVYNHLGPEGNYLDQFGPYFTDKYNTPWGKAINFDDQWSEGVRDYYVENALMWLRDFRIDALRLDAVHAIEDFGPVHVLRALKQKVSELSTSIGIPKYLLAESDLNDTRIINHWEQGGYGMDAQWLDDFHHSLRVSAGQERSGYFADFDGVESLAKAFKDAYVYDGVYSEVRKKNFGVKASENAGEQFIVYSQNHDQVGNRLLGERSSELVSLDMVKLMAGAVLVSPFVPMLFMGEEYGETNPFRYFVDHSDEELIQAISDGRKKEFEAFHREDEAYDPVALETFTQSKLQWDLLEKEPHKTLHEYYKQLIQIRKTNSALNKTNRKEISVEHHPQQKTIVILRQHLLEDVVCLLNFSDQPQSLMVPVFAPVWEKVIASSDIRWKGRQDMPDLIEQELALVLPPESISIYRNQYE